MTLGSAGGRLSYLKHMLLHRLQDGSLVDLLDRLSKKNARLPVQDVLSIFFQVLLMPQRMCHTSF